MTLAFFCSPNNQHQKRWIALAFSGYRLSDNNFCNELYRFRGISYPLPICLQLFIVCDNTAQAENKLAEIMFKIKRNSYSKYAHRERRDACGHINFYNILDCHSIAFNNKSVYMEMGTVVQLLAVCIFIH